MNFFHGAPFLVSRSVHEQKIDVTRAREIEPKGIPVKGAQGARLALRNHVKFKILKEVNSRK
jgi:hypothetical protein